MDGWGSLAMLIRRQNADKRRKAEIRAIYKKRRKNYIHDNYSTYEFDFPKLTTAELQTLKKEIKRKIIRKRIVNFIYSSIIFLIALAGIIYLFLKKGFL